MAKRESLYHKYPDYRVNLDPSTARVRVSFAGEMIAESERTLMVRETKHTPVVYFPRDDVRLDLLEATSHVTFCPFKGEASYWTLRVGDRVEENVVWSYADPFDEVAGIKDYVSFYADRVDWEPRS
ncbi:MAG: DUF427 domain-containing protein [Myxococcota bacterium]